MHNSDSFMADLYCAADLSYLSINLKSHETISDTFTLNSFFIIL